MEAEEDFQRQLELENLEKAKEAQGYYHTDPTDGTVYEWDPEKRAWFPKVNEDFLAAYQASYGVDNTEQSTSGEASSSQASQEQPRQTQQQQEQQKKGEKRKADEGWFEVNHHENTKVYVSGLPDDVTVEEFRELMTKCGIIMLDEETEEPKIKLYFDNIGNPKGDGLCTYLKRESVDLAIQLLDDTDVRGKTITVEQAKFKMKGEYNANLKKKKKKKDKKKGKIQERLLSWRPDKKIQQKKRHEQVVIIKHMFHPSEFDEDATLITDLKDDLMSECSKFGDVAKVMIFDNHPEGVTSVKFKDGDDADKCVLAMNGRWFAKRQLTAEIWDGKTDYKVEETDQEREARLSKWEQFLQDEDKKAGQEKDSHKEEDAEKGKEGEVAKPETEDDQG